MTRSTHWATAAPVSTSFTLSCSCPVNALSSYFNLIFWHNHPFKKRYKCAWHLKQMAQQKNNQTASNEMARSRFWINLTEKSSSKWETKDPHDLVDVFLFSKMLNLLQKVRGGEKVEEKTAVWFVCLQEKERKRVRVVPSNRRWPLQRHCQNSSSCNFISTLDAAGIPYSKCVCVGVRLCVCRCVREAEREARAMAEPDYEETSEVMEKAATR